MNELFGLQVRGYYLGRESKYYEATKDKPARTAFSAAVACGMDSYKITMKDEEVPKLDAYDQFAPICIKVRPYVGSGRLYFTDGVIVDQCGE